MKKVLLVMVAVCLFLPVVAQAAPPEEVDGYFFYVPAGDCRERLASDNLIWRDCTDVGTYYAGAFIGTSNEVYDCIFHGFQGYTSGIPPLPEYERGWYKGRVTFNGTVLGIGGEEDDTMVIMFVGKSPGGPGGIFKWSGTWRIIGGTGDLANVHGQGVWASCEPDECVGVHYEGKIKFSP